MKKLLFVLLAMGLLTGCGVTKTPNDWQQEMQEKYPDSSIRRLPAGANGRYEWLIKTTNSHIVYVSLYNWDLIYNEIFE